MMTPLDDFLYLVNNVLLGNQPTIEDFILLVGTIVAFVAFVLWCCFPVTQKESEDEEKIDYEDNDYELSYIQRKHERCSL